MKQNAFPVPSTKCSVLLPASVTIMKISADGLNTFVLHLCFSVSPPWDMGSSLLHHSLEQQRVFCAPFCLSLTLLQKVTVEWIPWEKEPSALHSGDPSPLGWTGHFSAHQIHFCKGGWFSVDFLLPSVGFLSFLPPARLFPVPRARRHLNFLIWSCKRGEENTTTFRGLVEEQLEVHMGCLQAWLQELRSKPSHLLFLLLLVGDFICSPHNFAPDLYV